MACVALVVMVNHNRAIRVTPQLCGVKEPGFKFHFCQVVCYLTWDKHSTTLFLHL